jgi:hypothetical protein
MDTACATSFGAWADEYDDWRPAYPDAAVDWLVPPDGADRRVPVESSRNTRWSLAPS